MKPIIYIIFSVCFFFLSCSNNKIEGRYQKIEGGGTVFTNYAIVIKKIDEKTFLITAYDSNFTKEWEKEGKLTDKGKLIWSDAWLPEEISFDKGEMELLVGNGTFGKYRFKKVERFENESKVKFDYLN